VFSLTKSSCTLILVSACVAGTALAATQDDELLVDPTMPLSMVFSESAAASNSDGGSIFDVFSNVLTSYELSSVLIRAEDRIAIINKERVRVGDKVGSAVVASIEADHVTLNVDGELETLALYENSIKTPVKGNE
jgi:hypothetical protein